MSFRSISPFSLEEEDQSQRSFWERLFAPIEAPQQTLYKATTSIAENGFQFRDIWDSISHGARYFNPWSNVEAIEPDEIRQIFGGRDDAKGVAKFASNLAISLIYDPLLVAPVLRAAGLSGKFASNVGKAMNPLQPLLEGAGYAAGKTIVPAAKGVGRAAFGDRAETIGQSISRNLINRYAGVPEELQEHIARYNVGLQDWKDKGLNLIFRSKALGGNEGQRLLTEALELNATAYRHDPKQFVDLSGDIKQRFADLNSRVESANFDTDLFWEVVDRARSVDDEMGRQLVKWGVVPEAEYQEFKYAHTRRLYTTVENSDDYQRRVFASLGESKNTLSMATLRKSLNDYRSELSRTALKSDEAGLFDPRDALGVRDNPYFTDTGRARLNVKRFTNDLQSYLDITPEASVDEIMTHVRGEMLSGSPMYPEFWRDIANYVSGAFSVNTGKPWDKIYRVTGQSNGITWRTFNEQVANVRKRKDLDPETREELGEILEFAPRVASQTVRAGKTLETRKFTDQVAGVIRVDEESADDIKRLRELYDELDLTGDDLVQGTDALFEASNEAADIGEKLAGRLSIDTADEFDRLIDLNYGDMVKKIGTPWSATEQGPLGSQALQLGNSPALGEAAGMWVTPGVYSAVNKLEGVGYVQGDEASNIAQKFGQLMRRGTGYFKLFKVILDPTAQFRNLTGGALAMDMMGINPLRPGLLLRAAGEVRTYAREGDPGKYLSLAKEAGVDLFTGNFTNVELREIADKVSDLPLRKENLGPIAKSIYSGLNAANHIGHFAIRTFSTNEMMLKLGTFIGKFEDLKSSALRKGIEVTKDKELDFARQASSVAVQALFDYGDVPYMIDFARKYGIIPFATFPFKSVPLTARTLYENPHRVLKYPRAIEEINKEVVGSPEDVAAEINSLPTHVRDKLVVRMPWDDKEGRPQYVDMAYFMPWYTIQDIKEQLVAPVASVLGARGTGPPGQTGQAGFRGGVLSPPGLVMLDALRHNKDSLNRDITRPGMNHAERWAAAGKFIWQTILPSSLPGGNQAEAVGRAMQAVAQSSPEPMDWLNILGRGVRGPFPGEVTTKAGFSPQGQSQVGGSALGGLLGLEPGTGADPLLGSLQGILGGAVASDRTQTIRGAGARAQISKTELHREMARVRSDQNLSPSQRARRLRRLYSLLRSSQEQLAETVRGTF